MEEPGFFICSKHETISLKKGTTFRIKDGGLGK